MICDLILTKFFLVGQLSPFGQRPAAGLTKRMLILDSETTGLGVNSRIRSLATTEATMSDTGDVAIGGPGSIRKLFFRQPGMEGGLIQTPTGLKSLSEGVNELEGGLSIDVSKNPAAARAALGAEMEHYLSYDTIAIKNSSFDLPQLIQTAQNTPGYDTDKVFKETVARFSERISTDPSFITDVDFSGRLYMKQKFDNYATNFISAAATPGSPEEIKLSQMAAYGVDVADEQQVRNALYAKTVGSAKLFQEIDLGGSFTPNTMENLGLTTNLFELIHAEASSSSAPGSNAAKHVMGLMGQGSHIAETDTLLAGFYAKYVQTGNLDYSPGDLSHLPVGARKFVQQARRVSARSAAPTMTTNIADVERLSQASKRLLATDLGKRGFKVEASLGDVLSDIEIADKAAALGVSEAEVRAMEGVVSYSKGGRDSAAGYKFSSLDPRVIGPAPPLGVPSDVNLYPENFSQSIPIQDSAATSHIDRIFADAQDRSRDVTESYGIPGISATYNSAAQKIISTGINFGEQGEIDRLPLSARYRFGSRLNMPVTDFNSYGTGMAAIDEDSLIQSLTATSRLIAPSGTLAEEMSGKAFGSSSADINFGGAIRRALETGQIEGAARLASGIKNPYAGADITSRALSVELAKTTAAVGKNAFNGGISTGSRFKATSDEMRFIKNADVLSDLGLQVFNPQDITKLTSGNRLASKMLVGRDVFEKMEVNVAGAGGLVERMSLSDAMINAPDTQILQATGINVGDSVLPEHVVGTAAEMNKVRLSKVEGQDTINAFLGGEGAYTPRQSDVLATSLLDAAESAADSADLGGLGIDDIADSEAAEHVSETTRELRNLNVFINKEGKEEALSAVKEKIETGGLGIARITGDISSRAESTLGAVAERKWKRHVDRWKNF